MSKQTQAVYAKIGSHYDQEIAACATWLMGQFIENEGIIIDQVTERINETKDQAEMDQDEVTKYFAEFARLGILAALIAAGQRFMVTQED